MAEAAVTRPVRSAPKPAAKHSAKPSGVPVIFLTILMAVAVHFALCWVVGMAADDVKWHTFGIDSDVKFGEAQFQLNAIVSFLPFDFFFGFCFSVLLGFALRVPFF